MNRNVEIKAKVESLDAIESRARGLADQGPIVLIQEDTFFRCPAGRLKLRRFSDNTDAELIYYERPDGTDPRESRYVIHRTTDPTGLQAVLSASLGVRGAVRKRRALYLIGATRVHLDRVEGLGTFVELEVVLQSQQDTADGTVIARDLMNKLGIPESRLISKAYVDLLEADPEHARR